MIPIWRKTRKKETEPEMKHRKLPAVILILTMMFAVFLPGSVCAAEEKETVRAVFDCGFGSVAVSLKKGFSFLEHDSCVADWDLALTAVTLSGQIYDDRAAEYLLGELGYDYTETKPTNDRKSEYKHPAASFGYKHLKTEDGQEANVFAVVVRGTQNNPTDLQTDFFDGALSMFRDCGNAVQEDLFSFMERAAGKSTEQLKKESNYIFLTGHSLGGATANYLSVDVGILELVNNDKGRIYTYTFSAPHTCINRWGKDPESESNAFNIRDEDDIVSHMPPYPGAAAYGKDMCFVVKDLDDAVFRKLFPDAKGGSIREAPNASNYRDAPWGHHDRGLCLVYILQNGLAAGTWEELKDAADIEETDPSGSSPENENGAVSGDSSSDSGDAQVPDVSAYGIRNGTYLSTDWFNQKITFYGTNGISISAFGITADGTYEISEGSIIVSYDFFGLKTLTWDPSFGMNGDVLYIAGTAFYKE